MHDSTVSRCSPTGGAPYTTRTQLTRQGLVNKPPSNLGNLPKSFQRWFPPESVAVSMPACRASKKEKKKQERKGYAAGKQNWFPGSLLAPEPKRSSRDITSGFGRPRELKGDTDFAAARTDWVANSIRGLGTEGERMTAERIPPLRRFRAS